MHVSTFHISIVSQAVPFEDALHILHVVLVELQHGKQSQLVQVPQLQYSGLNTIKRSLLKQCLIYAEPRITHKRDSIRGAPCTVHVPDSGPRRCNVLLFLERGVDEVRRMIHRREATTEQQ